MRPLRLLSLFLFVHRKEREARLTSSTRFQHSCLSVCVNRRLVFQNILHKKNWLRYFMMAKVTKPEQNSSAAC